MSVPSRPARGVVRTACLAVVSALLVGCADDAEGRVLEVYAASSTTEAFTEISQAFERTHPDVDVRLTFAGSQVLRVQIEQGAAAHVFAAANPEHVDALVQAGLAGEPVPYASNELVVVTPISDPVGIASFGDLPRASRMVLGTENVPVGAYAREAIARGATVFGPDFPATVLSRLVSEEANTRLVRAKVELGEADAAIVYRTDVARSDRVRTVPIPPELNVRAVYFMAPIVVDRDPRDTAAEAWIAFVLSPEGQDILRRHGFLPPPPDWP